MDCFNDSRKKEETPYTIIFCKTVNDIVLVLNFFLSQLGQSVYVDGSEPPPPPPRKISAWSILFSNPQECQGQNNNII
jgi:hypothetical protein